MLNSQYTQDVNGEKAMVHVSGLIPCEGFSGEAAAMHQEVLLDLTKPWMTEHLSMGRFKLDSFDVEDCINNSQYLPKDGVLVKLSYLWSGVLDDEEMLCQAIHGGAEAHYVFSGYVWVQDMFDPNSLNAAVSSWALLQTNKMKVISGEVNLLDDEDLIGTQNYDVILNRVRAFYH
ncbi:hypothetical protein [Vibrio hepatarius]|uniref:hypothetical protein n=1 Tax=Vibrio hepatarius TaxID=171383 RepID=UPI001C093662|nr:hypothetical protein [Vibrio hepatarius]MBU2898313.1 hypothetical protein [Vibrio hepatarius]